MGDKTAERLGKVYQVIIKTLSDEKYDYAEYVALTGTLQPYSKATDMTHRLLPHCSK